MKRFCVVVVLMVVSFASFSFVETPISPLSKSLVFPVASKKSFIGSFWGAVRDGGKRKHEGIDIFARKGTPVVAICDGIIVLKSNTPRGGKVLWLQSTTYPMTVYYAHLDQQKVKSGQFVRKGQVIGTVGNTGNARYTPAHLHFGIYKYSGAVNPLPYVKNSKKVVVPAASRKANPALAKNSKSKGKTHTAAATSRLASKAR